MLDLYPIWVLFSNWTWVWNRWVRPDPAIDSTIQVRRQPMGLEIRDGPAISEILGSSALNSLGSAGPSNQAYRYTRRNNPISYCPKSQPGASQWFQEVSSLPLKSVLGCPMNHSQSYSCGENSNVGAAYMSLPYQKQLTASNFR